MGVEEEASESLKEDNIERWESQTLNASRVHERVSDSFIFIISTSSSVNIFIYVPLLVKRTNIVA